MWVGAGGVLPASPPMAGSGVSPVVPEPVWSQQICQFLLRCFATSSEECAALLPLVGMGGWDVKL